MKILTGFVFAFLCSQSVFASSGYTLAHIDSITPGKVNNLSQDFKVSYSIQPCTQMQVGQKAVEVIGPDAPPINSKIVGAEIIIFDKGISCMGPTLLLETTFSVPKTNPLEKIILVPIQPN